MSEQQLDKAWYRKYRPSTMKEYCGERIKRTVESRFTVPQNRPNVMMIYGTRGCGKTTFARIISKYYLCENPINGEPCEQCEICQSINQILIEGETGVECPGVTEVDATTANGKEAIQSIIEEAEMAPIYTKYKILILDECHMITASAQNSLLKIIEDIPPHLVVIFATTDPEKVLGTIHSRCQLKLEAKKQSVEDMANRLLEIAKAEQIETSMDALRLVAKKGNRVPRECINLLENIAKNYGNRVLLEDVIDSTGEIASEIYINFFKAANKNLGEVLKFNKLLKEKDMAIDKFFSGIMRFTLDAMYIKHGISLEDYTSDYVKTIKSLYDDYTSGDFDMLLQILEYAANHISQDDAKNEVLLTTTAMRIGKVKLLAQGLSKEQSEAVKENRESVITYGRQNGRSDVDTESLKQEINPDMLTRKFTSLKGVDVKEILSDAANIELNPTHDESTSITNNDNTFVAQDDILRMMESDD